MKWSVLMPHVNPYRRLSLSSATIVSIREPSHSAAYLGLRLRRISGLELVACLLALVVFEPRARAQQAEALQLESFAQPEYESVLAQALTFHAQGDYESARTFMERAHALEPSARTLRGLGIVAFAQGQHLAAIRYLDQALASEVKALPPDLRASVEQLRQQIWLQVGRYDIRLEPDTSELSIDGAPPDFYAPNTVALEPGAHMLRARAQGRGSYEMALDVKAGVRETLRVVLAIAPAPVVIEKLVPTAEHQAEIDEQTLRGWTPALRYAGIGAGAALILGGAALWATGRVRLDQVVKACDESAIGACTREEARRRYDDKHIGNLVIASAAAVSTGAALLVAVSAIEVYLWRHRDRKTQDRKVYPALSPSSLGLAGTF